MNTEARRENLRASVFILLLDFIHPGLEVHVVEGIAEVAGLTVGLRVTILVILVETTLRTLGALRTVASLRTGLTAVATVGTVGAGLTAVATLRTLTTFGTLGALRTLTTRGTLHIALGLRDKHTV